MKTEKEIQDEVWKQCVAYIQGKDYLPDMIDTKEIALLAVSKTIELTRPTIGIIRHEKIDVDAYKCGYEAALKELKNNVLKDSTAAIIHKNGYDEGYQAAAKEIQAKLVKTDLINVKSYDEGYVAGCTDSAEKLSEKTFDLYHKLEAQEVWGINGDIVCENCETLVQKIIGEVKKELTKK